jgi:hypothetical protein
MDVSIRIIPNTQNSVRAKYVIVSGKPGGKYKLMLTFKSAIKTLHK